MSPWSLLWNGMVKVGCRVSTVCMHAQSNSSLTTAKEGLSSRIADLLFLVIVCRRERIVHAIILIHTTVGRLGVRLIQIGRIQ
jgi:hypothetical protein